MSHDFIVNSPTREMQRISILFLGFWCKYNQFDNIIKRNWITNIRGANMFKFVKKLKTIKYEIKDWSKKHFGNLHDKITKNGKKIEYVEERFLLDSNNYRFNSWVNPLLKQRGKLMLFNQKYCSKHSRENG